MIDSLVLIALMVPLYVLAYRIHVDYQRSFVLLQSTLHMLSDSILQSQQETTQRSEHVEVETQRPTTPPEERWYIAAGGKGTCTFVPRPTGS